MNIYNIKKNTKQLLGIAWNTKIFNYLNKTGGFGGLWWKWWGKKEANMFSRLWEWNAGSRKMNNPLVEAIYYFME